MAATRVRSDIWTLEDQGPWHPITDAYSRAVLVMQSRSDDELTSWAHQAAIHSSTDGDWRVQCQHQSYFFLPWHRIYLYWFEAIVRAALDEVDEVEQDVKDNWALPYWNYGRGGRFASLPQAFLDPKLPDGTDNGLFTVQRKRSINSGQPLPDFAIHAQQALAEGFFDQPQFTGGFGGAVTGLNHFAEDPNAQAGALEITPHGVVHNEVGGFMRSFETAGLDPVFWMHHANIDRLWKVWLSQDGRENPSDSNWSDEEFSFPNVSGTMEGKNVESALETTDLGYTYEDESLPEGRLRGRQAVTTEQPPDHPPELVGASDEHVELSGERAAVSFPLAEAQGPAARSKGSERVYLNIEGVEGKENPGVTYGVYLNLPDGDDSKPDAHHVGNIPFFGIEKAGDVDQDHPGLRYAFDVTDVVAGLRESDAWKPDEVSVTFEPLGDADEGGDERRAAASSPIRVGRVGLYYQ
jgi:tyrosinase